MNRFLTAFVAVFLLLLPVAAPVYAAKIMPVPIARFFDSNGDPLASGKVYTYEAGTSTPKTTYTDSTEGTPNANPVILDSDGEANIWLGSGSYKIVLKDSNDATQWTVDNILGDTTVGFGQSVTNVSTNTSVTTAHENTFFNCSGSPTLSLLAAADADNFIFGIRNTSTGVCTIDPANAETINGAATVTVNQNQSAIVYSNGTAWFTLALDSLNDVGNNAFTGTNSFSATSTFTGKVITPDDGELTIATGAVTVTGLYHTVDTEADAASDDLDTINGGADGQLLILQTEDSGRDVAITQAGNIVTPFGVTNALNTVNQSAVLVYSGALSKWVVVNVPSAYATAAQGATADTAIQLGTRVTLGTLQASTSGSDIDFTSIPSTAKEITINFSGVSSSGTADYSIQIGDSGGVETTGYLGFGSLIGASAVASVNYTTSFGIQNDSAAAVYHGAIVLTLMDASTNRWNVHGVIGRSDSTAGAVVAGSKALSATLDRVRITTSDTWDAGSLNISYK